MQNAMKGLHLPQLNLMYYFKSASLCVSLITCFSNQDALLSFNRMSELKIKPILG